MPEERTLLSYAVVDAKCEVHRTHRPAYAYCEAHHIIPQSWQQVFTPPGFKHQADKDFPYAGPSPDHTGLYLWDARTVHVCRTGHGNVHFWLVKIMHIISDIKGDQSSLRAAVAQAQDEMHKIHQRIPYAELDISVFAITRFTGEGGSLQTLFNAKQFGAI